MQRTEVEGIARLARLALSAAERERYGAQLTDILAHFEKIQALSTRTPADPGGDAAPTRPDEVRAYPLARPLLAACAETAEGHIVVPRILD